jgi:hypothetical protein
MFNVNMAQLEQALSISREQRIAAEKALGVTTKKLEDVQAELTKVLSNYEKIVQTHNVLYADLQVTKQALKAAQEDLAKSSYKISDPTVLTELLHCLPELSGQDKAPQDKVSKSFKHPAAPTLSTKGFEALANGIPHGVKLTMAEANALLQLPRGVMSSLVYDNKQITLPLTYEDVLTFIASKVPDKSSIKSTKGFAFIPFALVREILDVEYKTLHKMVKDGVIPAYKVNRTNIVFFWKDIVTYIKNTYPKDKDGKTIFNNYKVIPHVFYKNLYSAIANDSSFSHLENTAIFGFVDFCDDWNIAHALLGAFDSSIAEYLDSYDTYAKGNLKVRDWAKKKAPEFLNEILTLGEAGYIKYLTNYTSYEKDGTLSFLGKN